MSDIPAETIASHSDWRRAAPDVLACGIGLGVAWALHWTTTDLVWSLWLSSLTLGYVTILSTIGAGIYIGVRVITHEDFPPKYRVPAIAGGTAVALFLFGFFSLHFCGFHAGHASFLAYLFPLEGVKDRIFMDAFMNPILLWRIVFRHILPRYAPFVLAAIIAERRQVFRSLIDAVHAVRQGEAGKVNPARLLRRPKDVKKAAADPFARPYINVVRMHLLIFFFAFSHALKIDSFVVFAVVYVLYFFPWKTVVARSRSGSEKGG